MPIKYKVIIKMIDKKNKHNYRIEIIRYVKKYGISETARVYNTTRKTVRKWRDRYLEKGFEGLKDQSRAPNYIPHKMTEKEEQKILELRSIHKAWGAWRLKDRYGLKRGENAIHRVIKQNGCIKKKKRKWKKQVDLRETKAKLKVFEQMQWDTKDLNDIEDYYPKIRLLNLPRYNIQQEM